MAQITALPALSPSRPFGAVLSALARGRFAASPPTPASRQQPLQRHATIALGSGMAARVLRGCVWLTVDGSPKDVILEPGDAYENRQRGRVLLHALADAVVSLAPAGPVAQNR